MNEFDTIPSNDSTLITQSLGLPPDNGLSGSSPLPMSASSMPNIRYEAEDLTLNNFLIENNNASSDGQHISLLGSNSNSGTATGIFNGAAGTYQVNIAYYDENDGVSNAQVTVANEVKSFLFDKDLPGNAATADTLTSYVTHPIVELQGGESFEIQAEFDLGEFARIDYIEFVPVQNPFQPDGSLRYEAEGLELTNYQAESTNPTASGGSQISLSNTGFNSGTAMGIFAGESGTYRVRVGYYDENDGISSATVTVAGQSRSFEFDDDFPASGAVPETLTSRVTHSVIGLKPGDVFKIEGQSNFGEFARVDFIEFIPVDITLDASNTIRYEAENFQQLGNYVVDSNNNSSAGQHISLYNSNPQKINNVFDGETGFYQVKLGYYDENDGVSSAIVTVGGQSQKLLFDKDLPGAGASAATLTESITHQAVRLQKGETFEIEAKSDFAEYARLDYIEFVAVNPPDTSSTYYVSPDGDDSNPGTEQLPWKTVNYAVSQASAVRAGDTILVQPGQYTELVNLGKSGDDELGHITLKANGQVTLIDPDPINGNFREGVIQSVGKGYWIIDGFRIEDTSWAGISLRDANNMIVQNNHTFETGASGIIIMPDTYFFGGDDEVTSKDIKVLGNTVERANWRWAGLGDTRGTQEALSIWGVDGFEVANNLITRGKREGIDAKTGSRNGSIHSNTVTGVAELSGTPAGYNAGAAIYIEGNRADTFNIDVYNNLVYSNIAEGIVVADEVPGQGDVSDIRVYNNVVYGNGTQGTNSGAGIMVTSNVNDVEVINNTVVGNVQSIVIDGTDYTNGYTTYDVLVRNNIFASASFRNGLIEDADNVVLDNNLFTNNFNQLYQGGTGLTNFVETNNIQVGTVGFVDSAGNNYRLSANSAAIDVGSDLIPDYASIDIDGIVRDEDGDGDGNATPDIGAYEYVA
ncbi:MAG: right-handed parallel beta-helix repeat-containing protein [Cyanobacteria bacterium J06621_15]